MRLARVGLVIALMLAPFALGQQKAPEKVEPKVGYDIGACRPDEFYAIHFDVVGDDLKVTLVNEGPNKVQQADPIVLYKFKEEKKDGRHYFNTEGDIELILNLDKVATVGVMKLNGKVQSILYGMAGDGSKLAENGVLMYKVCLDLKAGHEPKDVESVPDQKNQGSASQDDIDRSLFFTRGTEIVKI